MINRFIFIWSSIAATMLAAEIVVLNDTSKIKLGFFFLNALLAAWSWYDISKE